MKVIIENKEIKVESPYNKDFIARAKQIQGKWSSPYWVFPEENRDEVKELLIECYGECGQLGEVDTVTIELNLDTYRDERPDSRLKLGSMVLLERKNRDRQPIFAENVILVTGGFKRSGGSWKSPRVAPEEGTVLRVKGVPVTVYSKFKDSKGVTLVSDIDKEALMREREKLVERIAEIDALIKNSNE